MSLTDSPSHAFADAVTRRIVDFLVEVGLVVRDGTIEERSFLPGILVRDGELIVDESRLKHPGDLLHEAGHLAVVAPEKRRRMGTDAGIEVHEEVAAIAWSWAALHHLGLPPEVVFHVDGYKGESAALIDALSDTRGPGIPSLAWFGMCADPHAGPDVICDLPPFPTMTSWLRKSADPT